MELDKFYTVNNIADIFDVKPFTARKWCREGLIETIRLPGGQFRASGAAIKKFADGKYGDVK